jgi:hypothetical protein
MQLHTIIDSDTRDSERSWIYDRKDVGGRVYNINILHQQISDLSGTAGAIRAHTFKVPEIDILVDVRLKKNVVQQ